MAIAGQSRQQSKNLSRKSKPKIGKKKKKKGKAALEKAISLYDGEHCV